tara:strand:- start:2574 stop:4553 length:1980 start_codon:yes stop_codon:yes gene_type:complete
MAQEVAINLNVRTKEAIQNINKLDVEIKEAKELTSELRGENVRLEQQLSNTKNRTGIDKINKQLKRNRLIIKENTQAVSERNLKLADNKAVVKQTEETKKLNKQLADSTGLTSLLDRATGGMFSKFRNGAKSIAVATKGMKLFKFALASTGIGLIVVALASLIAVFKSTEEGNDKLTKGLNVLKSIFNNLVDLAASYGKTLLSLGGSIIKVFKGDFKGAIADAGNAFKEFSGDVKGFAADVKNDMEATAKIADLIAKANRIDRDLMVEREKANVRINDLRIKGYDIEKFTVEERIGFLQKALEVENEITDKEIEAAKIRRDAKIEENKLSGTLGEAKDEEAKLTAAVLKLESKKLSRQREVISSLNALRRKDYMEREKERKKEFDAFKKDLEDKMALERGQMESLFDIRKLFADKNLKAADLSEQVRLNMEREIALTELNDLQVADGLKGMARLEINTFFDGEQTKLNDKKGLEEEELVKQKIQLQHDFLDAAIQVAGAETKVGRALFIYKQGLIIKEQLQAAKATLVKIGLLSAESGVHLAKGGAATAAKGFPANIPLLLAFGIQAAGIIMSVKSAVNAAKGAASKMGASGGGGSSPSLSLPTSAAPSFNIVGSSAENQLAESLSSQNKQPIKAFVTASDVTSAQELDRNIIENAAIG